MTEAGFSPDSTLVKTDKLGRMRTSPERREMLLDEFEQSGMSAPAFSAMVGINYQTFAGWRQRRGKVGRSISVASPTGPTSLQLVEAVVTPRSTGSGEPGGLLIHLPGQARLELSRADQLPLACALLKSLGDSHQPC